MLKLINVFIGIAMICVLISCSDDKSADPVATEAGVNQTVIVTCEYQTSYHDSLGNFINQPNVKITGKYFGDKQPEYINCKVNGVTKTRKRNYCGYTLFGDLDNYKLTPVTSDLELLNIEVTTEQGTVSGTVSLPDIPGSLQLSVTDTLPLNTDLTISWVADSCAFYRVWLTYNYSDYTGKNIDTLVTTNSITFPASYFHSNGEISFIDVTSYNGAVSGLCEKANLQGSGQGFAAYFTIPRKYEGSNIIVGNGISKK